jgi:hypothetical protein
VTAKPLVATTNLALLAEISACQELNKAKEATAPTAAKAAVNHSLALLLSTAEKDPTLWTSPTFTAAMTAVLAQTAPKPPA